MSEAKPARSAGERSSTLGLSDGDALLLARLDPAEVARNGVPGPSLFASRERALREVLSRLRGVVAPADVRVSPLGPGWSQDLDVHPRVPVDPELVASFGWIPARAIASWLPGTRYAVVAADAVLGGVDFHAGARPDPLAGTLARAHRRREVRLREVLELRVLVRSGAQLPDEDPAVLAASRAEAALGGSELRRWLSDRPVRPPVRIPGRRSGRALRRVRRAIAGGRRVVAVLGTDDRVRSSLASGLVEALCRAGIPAVRVSTSPAYAGVALAWSRHLAARVIVVLDRSRGASASLLPRPQIALAVDASLGPPTAAIHLEAARPGEALVLEAVRALAGDTARRPTFKPTL